MSGPSYAELVIEGRRVVTPTGVRPARLRIAGGLIRAVEPTESSDREGSGPSARQSAPENKDAEWPRRVEAGDALVMPGVVDTHVHVDEPGRTAWEGFRSATDAAAAGGVTTLVDMPLNCSPTTTDVPALQEKAAKAEGRCRVDCGFWGGAIPGNAGELGALAEAGVLGFKAFLCPSGIDEFPPLAREELRDTLAAVAETGLPLLVHAELPECLREPPVGPGGGPADPRAYATYLATRPPEAELEAIRLLLEAAAEAGARVHVVHLSSAAGLEPLRRARAEGVAATAETCPHYLAFEARDIPDGATAFKCAPPIRDAENREALWRALGRGELDLVASDHSPCPPALRDPEGGDFLAAWGGIASLQVALPAMWTEARKRGHGPEALARWMCEAPARLAGLEGRKGRLAPGLDADVVVWDPDAEWTVRGRDLLHRHPVTPYEGRRLAGRVLRTFVGGVEVFGEGGPSGARPGRWLRGRAA